MKGDIDNLQMQLHEVKDEYRKITSVAIASHVKMEHSFKLYSEEACYKLSIECQAPIDLVCIRGDVAVDLLE